MTVRLDPWEYEAALQRYGPAFPLEDYTAFERYARHRWVYDKYDLHRRLNKLPSYLSNPPQDGQYVLKPRINLDGLATGVRMLGKGEEVPPGFVAQSYLTGVYLSSDYFISRMRVDTLDTYRARRGELGEFKVFYRSRASADVANILALKLWQQGYEGYLNVETIGENILEAHLRPALQFWDQPKYSLVFRKSVNATAYLDEEYEPPITLHGISSVQRCWLPEKPLSFTDPRENNFRYLVVNTNNLREGIYYGNMISSRIRWEDL